MRDCGVSKVVVGRALTCLQAQGVLESRPRSGLYRSERSATTRRAIDYLFFGHSDNLENNGFHGEILSSLVAYLAPRACLARVHMLSRQVVNEEVIRGVLKNPGAEVVTCSINMANLSCFQSGNRNGVPCLHLLPNFVEPVSPSLTLHDAAMVRQQIELLTGLGHRRIAFLHAAREDEFFRPINVRRDAFCRLAVEYKLDLEPEWVRYVSWDAETVRREVRQMMTADRRPTGLIIYDSHVNPVYAELRACGFVPGRDVSVVGTDDMSWAEHVDPPLTSLRVSRPRIVEMVWEMLEEIRAGGDPGIRYVETEMMVRQSTCACAVGT
jgi:DNA-binding LacI/PurR family transcriptional regulator